MVLSRSGLVLSRLGLGTAWLGNMYQAVEDAAAAAVVRRALELGVRVLDTAPLYGFGLAERRLGEALSGAPRDSFVLATKVGRVLRPRTGADPEVPSYDNSGPLFVDAPVMHADFDFSYEATMACLAASLQRLGLDRVDVVLIHDPDDHFDAALDGAYRALHDLRQQGTVGAIGVGMNQSASLTRFARHTDVDLVLLAGQYTLLDQTALTDLLPVCRQRDVAVIVGGVYNTGILADPRPGACYKYAVAPPAVVHRAQHMQQICARYGVPLKAAAIQFPFGHPAVRCVLAGVRSVEELDDNAAMLATPIPAGVWHDLRHEGLLPHSVPVPGSSTP